LLPPDILDHTETICKNISRSKGVYTVLLTLGIYKILHPEQDIRYFKIEFSNGFSGRSFDTQYITPTLKELGLPSMAESGWLTRSLEQADPYTLNYQGKITPIAVKEAFLHLINHMETSELSHTEEIIKLILKCAAKVRDANKTTIQPISNADTLTIDTIMALLEKHFSKNYHIHGGSKLPVLAFYSIYSILINELARYKDCTLAKLGSHTASDKTSNSSGDIEIMKNSSIYESIEIKHDKTIDSNILRIAQEKIYKFNPKRYYILSFAGIKNEDKEVIEKLIQQTKTEHGCQIIVNGIMHTIKYYLRLISSLEDFLEIYRNLVEQDTELMLVHKQELNELINQLNKSKDSLLS